jgi:hypothetical protein
MPIKREVSCITTYNSSEITKQQKKTYYKMKKKSMLHKEKISENTHRSSALFIFFLCLFDKKLRDLILIELTR